jgi:hypothetical protein
VTEKTRKGGGTDRAERREAVGSSAQGGEEQYRKTGAKQHCMAKRQAEQNKGEGAGILDRSSRNMAAGGGPKHNTEQ